MKTMIEENEIWKPVFGYEDYYEVSSLGRVRRLKKTRGTRPGRILSPAAINRNRGYLVVGLHRKDKQIMNYVHRIVASSFIGPPRKGLVVNHKDGDKQNNNVKNLEWCTQSENNKHAFRTGLRLPTIGSLCGRAKLDEKEALEIYIMANSKEIKWSDIADKYLVDKSTISRIASKKTWAHLHREA